MKKSAETKIKGYTHHIGDPVDDTVSSTQKVPKQTLSMGGMGGLDAQTQLAFYHGFFKVEQSGFCG